VYEGNVRAEALNIAEPMVFEDVNTYARGILAGIADVKNDNLSGTPEGRDQICTAIKMSIEELLTTDFVVEKQKYKPFKKKTFATDEEKKEILSKLDIYNQPFNIENEDKTFVRPCNSFDSMMIAMQLENLKNDPYASMVVVSPFESNIVDLLNMRVHYWDTKNIKGFEDEKLFKLVRRPAGARRQRPRDSQKFSD